MKMSVRFGLLALLGIPLLALGARVESGAAFQSISVGDRIRLTVPNVQPETTAWQNAVVANGGSYGAVDVRAVDYFVSECKAKGIWPLLDWVALFAGRNLNASLVAIKFTVGHQVMANFNFVEADYSQIFGITGDGSTKYLETGINRSQVRAADDVLLGAHVTGNPSSIAKGIIGNGSTGNLHIFCGAAGTTTLTRLNSASTTTVNLPAIGFVGVSRIPSDGLTYAFIGSTEASNSPAVSTGTGAINIFRRGPSEVFEGSISGGCFGGGLNLQQREEFRRIWNRTMWILGRPSTAEGGAWIAGVIANGGTYNEQDIEAVDYFVTQCKVKGIWDKLDWLTLFAGRDLNAALVPLKWAVGNSVIINNNFIEADFSPTFGLTGNGSNKRLIPGIDQSQSRASDDVSIGAFVTSLGSPGSLGAMFSGGGLSGNRLQLFIEPSYVSVGGRINSNNPIVNASVDAVGKVSGLNRIPTDSYSTAFTGAAIVTANQVTGVQSFSMEIFSRASANYFNGSLGGLWFGGGLTVQQRTDFVAIWKQTMAILNRPTS